MRLVWAAVGEEENSKGAIGPARREPGGELGGELSEELDGDPGGGCEGGKVVPRGGELGGLSKLGGSPSILSPSSLRRTLFRCPGPLGLTSKLPVA